MTLTFPPHEVSHLLVRDDGRGGHRHEEASVLRGTEY